MIVRLYAQTHPGQIAGVVFVDAFSPTVPAVFGEQWPIYRDQLLNPPVDQMPLDSMRSPESERVDLDASAAQVLSAPALPAMPLVVLTKTESFGGLTSVPGLPAEQTNTLYERRRKRTWWRWPRRPRRSSPPAAITTFSSPSPTWWSVRPSWSSSAQG